MIRLNLSDTCSFCGAHDELCLGACYECAETGERVAAQRTVVAHLATALRNVWSGHWYAVKYDMRWAWERLTRTGDYERDGLFEREYGVRL